MPVRAAGVVRAVLTETAGADGPAGAAGSAESAVPARPDSVRARRGPGAGPAVP
ncbi:hypothetical protein SBD_3202 [Streptomyces bottropensis ATCC 25435]|uniref:Uncharacterized protein n=1 Tax=Streptomyces bottropensis ATCC 25435 TaxID=1054862 RepID=M3EHU9_9ACTN|nr:hypothetical protein SBD_3202 [Streptomyces bottropensis ATCC 25435]